ncbi:DUF4097 family beta strand repeat-containing protein [Leuconostoc suionicum]|uniref:DUF4097 family beta strand repeat-containing protein n=1 Tax=Leuconostoc suionicum TaxID=1511761 RepID=UPI00233F7B0C|nr:DUF4097 family beta strand repeat-containing protein [Leuconostoc suionicum]MDC2816865.1 DUF4097 family beta strand repeat-containing protein [Leuconostoc suionicum]
MKRSVKIGLSLIVIGAVLALIGFGFGGGSSSISWNNGLKVIDRKTQKEKMVQQSYTYNDVKNIDVSTSLPVRIITGDVKKTTVKVMTYQKLPELSYQQNHLKITDKQVGSVSQGNVNIEFNITGFSWNYGNHGYQEGIVITVPQSQSLSDIQIDGQNSSDVSLSDVQADKISIQHVADTNLKNLTVQHDLTFDDIEDTDLNNVTTSTATIKSDYGDLTIQNSRISDDVNIQLEDGDLSMHHNHINTGKINTSDGDVTLMNNQLSGQLTVTAQDGDISALIGKSSVTAKTLDGDISAFNNHDDDQTSYTHKGTTGIYVISTDSGDVTIKQ